MRVLIVCSSGGHLTQALALRQFWGEHDRLWVTSPTADARSRLVGEEVIESWYPTVRNLPNLVRNYALAHTVLSDFKPDVVLSTGAAIAVPFFAQAHHFGARTVYLEPVDRITSPSLSGRLVYPLADQFFVQWEEMLAIYPEATPIGVVL